MAAGVVELAESRAQLMLANCGRPAPPQVLERYREILDEAPAGAVAASPASSAAGVVEHCASASPAAASSDVDDEDCSPRGQKREMVEAPAHEILGGEAPPADELEPLVKKPFDLRAVVRQRQEEEAARLRLIEEEYNQCAPAADTV